MEYITVNLFKVSQESVYLDVIAECLCGYIFNKIEVGIRTYDHYGQALTEDHYSLTDAILAEYPKNQTSKISARIPLSEFFGEGEIPPAIYSLTLGCVNGDGQIMELKFTKNQYYVNVSSSIGISPVQVEAQNLLLHNSEEINKLDSNSGRRLDGVVKIYSQDGVLLSNSDPYDIEMSSRCIGLDRNGSIGFYDSDLIIQDSGIGFLELNAGVSGGIGLPDSLLNRELFLGRDKPIFSYSGSVGIEESRVGSIQPSSLGREDGTIEFDTDYGEYFTIYPETGMQFNPGDRLKVQFSYKYTGWSGHCGLIIIDKNQQDNEVYTKDSVGYDSQYNVQYILKETDIQETGEIKIKMQGVSDTKLKDFTIKRYVPPTNPKLIISGDLTIPKTGLPNTDTHETTVYTSDTNSAFYYLMDNILNLDNSCTPISDEAIRNYLILYGHLQALENGQQSIAEEYFKILVKNFTKCGNNSRACGGPCGCQSSPCGPNQHHQHPTHNSCNCNS